MSRKRQNISLFRLLFCYFHGSSLGGRLAICFKHVPLLFKDHSTSVWFFWTSRRYRFETTQAKQGLVAPCLFRSRVSFEFLIWDFFEIWKLYRFFYLWPHRNLYRSVQYQHNDMPKEFFAIILEGVTVTTVSQPASAELFDAGKHRRLWTR